MMPLEIDEIEEATSTETDGDGQRRVLSRSLLETGTTKPMTCKDQLLFKESDRQKS